MARARKVLRFLGGGSLTVTAGVATNQVLSDGKFSWTWLYASFGVAILLLLYAEAWSAPLTPSAATLDNQIAATAPIFEPGDPPVSAVLLDKFTTNGHTDGLVEGCVNRAHIWLRGTGDREVFVTGIRLQHRPGQAASISTGAMRHDAQYAFGFRYGEGPTEHVLEPAIVINPQERDTVRFELTLYPVGHFPTICGRLYATVLYHLHGGEPGEVPIIWVMPEWRLLARLSGEPIPIVFPLTNGVCHLLPTGALRATSPAIADTGNARWSDSFDDRWLVEPGHVERLRLSITDPDPQLRMCAIWTLGELRDSGNLDCVLHVLRDDEPGMVQTALDAAEKIDSAEATLTLLPLLEDTRAWVRQRVAYTLGHLRDPRACASLVTALIHENTRIATDGYEWTRVSYHWDNRREDYVLDRFDAEPPKSRRTSYRYSTHGIARGNGAVSFAAAIALVEIGDNAVWSDVAALEDHPDCRVREAAGFVLNRLPRPHAAGG